MNFDHHVFNVSFSNSRQGKEILLSDAGQRVIDFLGAFGEKALVGEPFYRVIQEGDGESRFLRLLETTGYDEDAKCFFSELLQQLAHAGSYKQGTQQIEMFLFDRSPGRSLL